MIKLALTTVLAISVGIGTARANQITVDFTSLVAQQDITLGNPTNPSGYTLGGIKFIFDPQGSTSTATIDVSGVTIMDSVAGSPLTGGQLQLSVMGAIYFGGGFQFDFSLVPGQVDPLAALVMLNNTNADFFLGASDASGSGHVVVLSTDITGPYSTIGISPDPNGALVFNMSSFAYDAPEPGTYALLASGLLLVGLGRRRLSRRSS